MNTPEDAAPIDDIGGDGIGFLTVLYDAHCRLCRAARRWLQTRDQIVPLHFVAAGSAVARQQFPLLDHDATLRDITVIADTGEVYVGDAAWLACLWALVDYRETADRLSQPRLLPLARRVVAAAAAVRERYRTAPPVPGSAASASTTALGYVDLDERVDCADDRCG
ncbi:MAG TPA: DCC1-like thiol-disulfide oxidoreductase family protein [Micromonosporaceae bacterium]|nr:DCC1-like thiol-disulfide oxidoreductase family protein [Micromonosporaceae bacterium]